MRTFEERLEELHRRTAALRQAKRRSRNRLLGGAAVCLCLVLSVLFAAAMAHAPASAAGSMPAGAAASIFADRAVLGFVVVAVVAFCLGAMVTILCFRLNKQRGDGETKHDRRP